ncbi:hypothetical protein [Neobacillus drentensis]|uniref:hypothetical protein n=1 Tax=Neobacillus drentensis TaxID=220684 RepID=UPI00082425E9|nr:hypothetical protein [Neobacillus drentensis]
MNGELMWNSIISKLTTVGIELQTTTGLWFNASTDKGKLYVDKATIYTPSSKLSMRRPISKNDFYLYTPTTIAG